MSGKSQTAPAASQKEALFERGFKSWCENTAETLRRKLGRNTYEPLDPWLLAKALGVTVWSLDELSHLPPSSRQYLCSAQGDEWSAVTVLNGSHHIVVLNPRHSAARQTSNLMHELAHIIRGHKASSMVTSQSGFILRTFDAKQEAEAEWLSGALLLPRAALSYFHARRIPAEQVIEEFRVSKQMYQYRVGVTGVGRQYGHTRNSRSH